MSLDLRREALDRAEASLANATHLCLKPSPSRIEECRMELESVAASLATVCKSLELAPVDSQVVLERLNLLKQQAAELRTLHRRAISLLQGAEQQPGQPILGYSPTGVELTR